MGLTQGDYWSAGVDLPCPELVAGLVAQLTKYHPGSRAAKDTAELLAVLTRACELADALACVSVGYGHDLGNNLDGSGPSTTHAVREYEYDTRTWICNTISRNSGITLNQFFEKADKHEVDTVRALLMTMIEQDEVVFTMERTLKLKDV